MANFGTSTILRPLTPPPKASISTSAARAEEGQRAGEREARGKSEGYQRAGGEGGYQSAGEERGYEVLDCIRRQSIGLEGVEAVFIISVKAVFVV